MIKKILYSILFLIGFMPLQAQNSPEELGGMIFELFRNESYNFREVTPTTDQLIDRVETISPELIKNRLDDYQKEYSNKLKEFNKKCESILENGAASGIVWPEIELDSVKTYKKSVTFKDADLTATVEIIKLYIYFSSNQQRFALILDTVFDFDGQFLVSDDAIVLEKVKDKAVKNYIHSEE